MRYTEIYRKLLTEFGNSHSGKYKIVINMKMLMKNLYENVKGTVLVNNNYSEWFTTNVRIRQGFILSPELFKLFLESLSLPEYHTSFVGCGGMEHLRLANDTDHHNQH